MTIKPVIGRPTKYTNKTIQRVTHYTNECLNNVTLPTIEGLALSLGVGTRTLYDWEREHSDFSQTLDKLRDIQRELLITKGLSGSYNVRFSMFLLKAIHGMTEKEPNIHATQNNYLNISPDLLADALKLMNREEKAD